MQISDNSMHSPIFIGGTGRSGTSVVGDYIGNHPRVFRSPYEIRIFTDRAGLIDLKCALTRNFSHQFARSAVKEFISFTDSLCCAYKAPYLGYNINKRMKTDLLQARSNFLNEILIGEFRGWDKELHDRFPKIQVPARVSLRIAEEGLSYLLRLGSKRQRKTWKTFVSYDSLPVPKYFASTEPLAELIRGFVDSIFRPMMKSTGSEVWCDATPANLAYVDELCEIYPHAKFVCVVRHPFAVAQSMMERRWMPANAEMVANSVFQSYARIDDQLHKASVQKKVFMLKIEELCFEQTESELSTFLDFDFTDYNPNLIQRSIVNGWRERISKKNLAIFQNVLGPYVKKYGY